MSLDCDRCAGKLSKEQPTSERCGGGGFVQKLTGHNNHCTSPASWKPWQSTFTLTKAHFNKSLERRTYGVDKELLSDLVNKNPLLSSYLYIKVISLWVFALWPLYEHADIMLAVTAVKHIYSHCKLMRFWTKCAEMNWEPTYPLPVLLLPPAVDGVQLNVRSLGDF